MTAPDVIVIRGAPGSGKSVAAKRLATRIGSGVRLEVDALRSMIVHVDWTNQSDHIGTLSLAAHLTAGFLALDHRPVIVVDTFSGDKLVSFLKELHEARSEVEVRVVALITDGEVLRRRVESRVGDEFRDVQICQKLNRDVVRFLQPYEHVIDNSELTPEETVERILNFSPDLAPAV